jgi:hypothetical protein
MEVKHDFENGQALPRLVMLSLSDASGDGRLRTGLSLIVAAVPRN